MFSWWDNLSAIFTFQILGLVKGTQIGDAVHFFIVKGTSNNQLSRTLF